MTSAAPLVLVVEDEPNIRGSIAATLGAEGYRVVECETGRRALADAANHKPDLMILDLGLPDLDGVDVVRGVRKWSTLPIVVLSARTAEAAKVAALDAGADDYLTKPFASGELLARLRVALRHVAAAAQPDPGKPFTVGDLAVDLLARRVTVAGVEIKLTATEFRLLAALARSAGRVMTHRQLLREVWGPSRIEETHYLRIYMGALRHKLETDPAQPRYLLTETGVGYRLAAE
jgi:two-component system KDP operon response regulator KdpE